MKYFVVEPCMTSAGFEIKLQEKIDLKKAESAFSMLGAVMASSPVVMLARVDEYSISVYASGRMMVKSDKKMKQKEIELLAEKLVAAMEKRGCI